ncbi:polysaccharide deacetylase family protein [Sphingomonas bacterium]|uniref:polysaccharide deacetylase family protein n=1 Tax=Sphingomonas bacterium TaxID=1895847 RepID=UPI0026107450|nr:polysaccharide deacetylase family protein [Sphingomonas bacterium]MDB5679960.1 polysaccharide deacetylase [Sphingomonas bacterium]
MTAVLLTIDTELMWRHHTAGCDLATQVERSLEPAGVGIAYQLALLARHGLKATFFVDPMPTMVFGLDAIRPTVEAIVAAGQEVQLHLHPNWSGARIDDVERHGRFELIDYSLDEQRALIAGARDLLKACGAPDPVAFRAGSYAANDDTLTALTDLGFAYDSSHNGADAPWPSRIGLPSRQIAPVERGGVVEVPVTLIEDTPGHLRQFQICALSQGEMRAALDHAAAQGHEAVTIVGHSFELANRTGTRPNGVHVGRFEGLCAMLADARDTLPTAQFRDLPVFAGSGEATPLGPNRLRTRWRQAEQLWSNWVEERAA